MLSKFPGLKSKRVRLGYSWKTRCTKKSSLLNCAQKFKIVLKGKWDYFSLLENIYVTKAKCKLVPRTSWSLLRNSYQSPFRQERAIFAAIWDSFIKQLFVFFVYFGFPSENSNAISKIFHKHWKLFCKIRSKLYFFSQYLTLIFPKNVSSPSNYEAVIESLHTTAIRDYTHYWLL